MRFRATVLRIFEDMNIFAFFVLFAYMIASYVEITGISMSEVAVYFPKYNAGLSASLLLMMCWMISAILETNNSKICKKYGVAIIK